MTSDIPLQHWNHRIMRRVHPDGTIEYGLYEVYYNGNVPMGWTQTITEPNHYVEPEFAEDIELESSDAAMREGLLKSFKLHMLAFDKTTLDYETGKELPE